MVPDPNAVVYPSATFDKLEKLRFVDQNKNALEKRKWVQKPRTFKMGTCMDNT